ncbi:MAG: hypothetical protein Q8K64_12415 [Sediminibacterium sp.]|nr:hypothetical protein [Sediminibacterium sp.]
MSETKTTIVVVDDGRTITTSTTVETSSPSPEPPSLLEQIFFAPATAFEKTIDALGDKLG